MPSGEFLRGTGGGGIPAPFFYCNMVAFVFLIANVSPNERGEL